MKKQLTGILLALMASVLMANTALAAYIAEPDSVPLPPDIYIYRNVLTTSDMLIVVKESTPYDTPPAMIYSDSFIWRLMDTDGTTEIAQSVGYWYNDDGYNYNIISFYLSAAEVATAGIAWEDLLKLRLSGTPVAFAAPPSYTFDIAVTDYTDETVSDEVKADISERVLLLAHQLDTHWSLTSAESLLAPSETGLKLSVEGQSFFRGAIYGIQAMAPDAFPMVITATNTTDREWTSEYSDNLTGVHAGSYIGTALDAGATFLDVGYNLFGLLLVIGIIIVLIFATWYLAGGNIWKGLVEASPALVICARMSLIGLGEVGLVAAICWLYISAKLWRMI